MRGLILYRKLVNLPTGADVVDGSYHSLQMDCHEVGCGDFARGTRTGSIPNGQAYYINPKNQARANPVHESPAFSHTNPPTLSPPANKCESGDEERRPIASSPIRPSMAISVPALALGLLASSSDVPSLAFSSSRPSRSSASLLISSSSNYASIADLQNPSVFLKQRMHRRFRDRRVCASSLREEPLKIIISGAPASGKGTQCEMIAKKYGLVHISTGDLLRAEVSSETKTGLMVKKYMENGLLVPDDIVTDIVKARMSQKDAKERGWLLDGYPRTRTQARSLENSNIRPDIFLLLDVPDEVLVDRSVGRRIDPVTGKIYHLKYFPPKSSEISLRLVARPDDMEEKVKARIKAYNKNLEAVSSVYTDLLAKIDGNRHKELVFESIDALLNKVKNDKSEMLNKVQLGENVRSNVTSLRKANWRGIPTRLNNIPHSKEIREYFYDDVLQATQRAIEAKQTRLKVEINIPELNPEMDVYRIGTLMELVRVLALSFADDGKYVKVCVQGSMGQGALSGMPLQLAGSRRILEFMDWGEHGALGTFVNIGSIGAQDVSKQDDIFILVAPQNVVGNCIVDDLRALTDEAGDRPVILVNPRLKDLPSSSGIMQTMGREKRLEYSSTFQNCYLFRLLYYAGTLYPIMGAIRMSYPYKYELYRRVDEGFGKERYVIISTFPGRPTILEINDAFEGKPRSIEKSTPGLWGFLSSIF